MSSACFRVFVYGSLMAGEGNHCVISKGRFMGIARTSHGFSLYDLGRFPGMVASGSGKVQGELFEVDAQLLASLDAFEGHPRFYQRTTITLEDGSQADAYLLTEAKVRGRSVVPSGSWRSHRRRSNENRHA